MLLVRCLQSVEYHVFPHVLTLLAFLLCSLDRIQC